MQLRPYQTQLVTEIRGQYQLGRKAVLAVLPTGGGKTVCFSLHSPSRQRQRQPGADLGAQGRAA
jgi:superfamily II DNA or RNA helicase